MRARVLFGWLFAFGLVTTAGSAVGADWQSIGPFGASVNALAVSPSDPATMYVAASSIGIFRSDDGGDTWHRTGFAYRGIIAEIVVDADDPETLYLATSGGFYRSDDAGETAVAANHGLSSTYLNALARDPTDPRTFYAGAWGGLFKTTDGGKNWIDVGGSLGDPDVQTLAIDPARSGIVYAGTAGQGVYRSTDGGRSWLPCSAGLSDPFIRDLAVDPSNPQTLYAATNHGGVHRSDDGGATWVPSSEGIHGGSFRLALDPRVSDTVYVGTQGSGVFRSVDRGATWETWSDGLPTRESIYALAVRPDTGEIVAGLFSRGVFRRATADAAWSAANVEMTGYVVSSLVVDATSGELIAGIETYGPSIFRSADGGTTWTISGSGMFYPPVYCLMQSPAHPDVFLTGNAGSLFRSTDGGETWTPSDDGLERGYVRVYSLVADSRNPSTVLAGTSHGIFLSADGGATWGSRQLPDQTIRTLVQAPRAPQRFFASVEPGGLFLSRDAGATWARSDVGLPAGSAVRAISFDPLHPGTIYAGTDGAGIYRSDDAGSTWTAASADADGTAKTFALLAPSDASDEILAGTASGVLRLERDSGRWVALGSGLPDRTEIYLLCYASARGRLYAGGVNGLFTLRWSP